MASARLPDWVPDWAVFGRRTEPEQAQQPAQFSQPEVPQLTINTQTSDENLSQTGTRRETISQDNSQLSITHTNNSNRTSSVEVDQPDNTILDTSTLNTAVENEGNSNGHNRHQILIREKTVIVTPSEDRTVNRKLRGIHLSMIAVNATLGTGLYWRGGQILELSGPLSVLLAFLLPGILAWAVMQCITEMLCIWPIPGALSVYVGQFVDVELGIAVGVTYWFVYSVSFSALVATSAAEIHFWITGNKAFDGGVVYFLIPVILIGLNSFRVDIYGWIEVISSSIKIMFLLVVIFAMVAINAGAGNRADAPNGTEYWNNATEYDTNAANGWFQSLCMSLSISSFAFVGVEVVAASALEARWPRKKFRRSDGSCRTDGDLLIGQTVKFSSVYIPVLATIAYVIAGVLATFNIRRDDQRLPRLSWVTNLETRGNTTMTRLQGKTTSAFVAIAAESKIPHLKDVFNVFLVFTALTCAMTNLYVASRALFGLTTRLDSSGEQTLFLRCLAWFGKTNSRKVPMRAMIFSALAFWWVPFLQLNSESSNISMFIEILTTMGSDGVIIVWACECWAFIRYYHSIRKHRAVLEDLKISQVRRWDRSDWKDYPYRSHMQPLLAYFALAGCLFLLVVCNSALLWKDFHVTPFFSTFLLQFVFIMLWVVLKLVRGGKWSLVDLDNADRLVNKIRELHDIRLGAS